MYIKSIESVGCDDERWYSEFSAAAHRERERENEERKTNWQQHRWFHCGCSNPRRQRKGGSFVCIDSFVLDMYIVKSCNLFSMGLYCCMSIATCGYCRFTVHPVFVSRFSSVNFLSFSLNSSEYSKPLPPQSIRHRIHSNTQLYFALSVVFFIKLSLG